MDHKPIQPMVLFLGPTNTRHTLLAEVAARRLLGDPRRVASAGLHPAPVVPEVIVRIIEETGLSAVDLYPKMADTLAYARAEHVVLINLSPETVRTMIRRSISDAWQFATPDLKDVEGWRRVRDAVFRKVEAWLARNCDRMAKRG